MKMGRKPRQFNPRIPHFSARMAVADLPPPPSAVDYTVGMPASLGVMHNDALGDCTCAAYYHALQLWSFAASGTMETESDDCVLALYEGACGYNPADPNTDQGGDEQHVLDFLLNNGAPIATGVHRLTAFVEVDPRNLEDVKRIINDCGCAYIGFNVPKYLMSGGMTAPGATWTLQSSDADIEGGHAVVLAGYDDAGARVISWGNFYTMTWEFFTQFVDEVYALCDPDWIRVTGQTPANMTVAQLEELMSAVKQ
jgi:hypothetical protein